MRKRAQKQHLAYAQFARHKETGLKTLHRKQLELGDKKDRQLQYAYPVIHKDHYLSTKSRKVADAFNVKLNEFGELQDIIRKDE